MARQCSRFLNSCQATRVQFLRNDRYRRRPYNRNVLDWYLKDWLATLQVSQAELVRRTDYPKAKVSNLVTGEQRYNRDVVNDVASALHIQPYELLMHPSDAMAQRRFKKAAEDLVQLPHLGSTTDEFSESRTGTAG